MKNIKLIVLTTMTMLFLGMGNVNAQEEPSKTVIIRVTEGSSSSAVKLGLVTIDAEGNTNAIVLEKGHDLDVSASNGALIQKEIEKWKQEGYEIKHFSTSGETIFRTMIILEK